MTRKPSQMYNINNPTKEKNQIKDINQGKFHKKIYLYLRYEKAEKLFWGYEHFENEIMKNH